MRYKFTCFETDIHGKENGNKVSTSFHADTLHTMLERFEQFLRGSGFHFNGVVDIVPEEGSEGPTPSISKDDHNEYYYDFDRNKPFPFTIGSNDWDNYSDLPSPNSYADTGAAQSTFNVNLDGDYEIKLDASNINLSFGDTMAGYPHER